MKVYFVGAGPGDPELLTVKAQKVIKEADVIIYAGSLVTDAIVAVNENKAKTYDSSKLDLNETTEIILNLKNEPGTIARIHSGEPSIYGAIDEQIAAIGNLGIDIEVIPGISAFQAAAAALKKELTVPDISQTVIITRIAGRTPVKAEESLASLAAHKATLCIYLSVDRIADVVAEVQKSLSPETPVVVVANASRPDQQILEGKLSNIAMMVSAQNIKKTAVILIGESLARWDNKSLLYDPAFTHMYRDGKSVGSDLDAISSEMNVDSGEGGEVVMSDQDRISENDPALVDIEEGGLTND